MIRMRTRTNSCKRIQVEAVPAATLRGFLQMAWPYMDPEPFTDGKHIRIICHHLQPATSARSQQCCILRYSVADVQRGLSFGSGPGGPVPIHASCYRSHWQRNALATAAVTVVSGTLAAGSVSLGSASQDPLSNHRQRHAVCRLSEHRVTNLARTSSCSMPRHHRPSEAEREMARIFWFETAPALQRSQAGRGHRDQQRTHMNDVAGECRRSRCGLPALELGPQLNEATGAPSRASRSARWVHRRRARQLWRNAGSDYAIASQQQQRPQPLEVAVQAPLVPHHQASRGHHVVEPGIGLSEKWVVRTLTGRVAGKLQASNTYIIGNITRDLWTPAAFCG
jgi:hypothetical protein